MAKYRSHTRKKDKDRVLAGYRAALNNPGTSKEGRAHARKMLILKGHPIAAFSSTSMSTRLRRFFGLRAKHRS